MYQLDELQADSLMCLIAQPTHDLAAPFDVKLNQESNYDEIINTCARAAARAFDGRKTGHGQQASRPACPS